MRKKQIQITIDQEQVEWIDERIDAGIFGSRSHAIRQAINCLMASS